MHSALCSTYYSQRTHTWSVIRRIIGNFYQLFRLVRRDKRIHLMCWMCCSCHSTGSLRREMDTIEHVSSANIQCHQMQFYWVFCLFGFFPSSFVWNILHFGHCVVKQLKIVYYVRPLLAHCHHYRNDNQQLRLEDGIDWNHPVKTSQ